MTTAKMYKSFMLLLLSFTTTCMTNEIRWEHRVDLDDNFQLLWRVQQQDIIFEVRVRTHGYIGFGFARNEYIYGADMVIGWVDNNHTFFKVSKYFNPHNLYTNIINFVLPLKLMFHPSVPRKMAIKEEKNKKLFHRDYGA